MTGSALSAKLLTYGTLKTYTGLGHGLGMINSEVVNANLLAFIEA